ncbi:MAG TPA: toprim domain-containing protein, partial [Clostridia bacterium]|nr:toprim domain-containing protein [Clostridia bacterium]
MTRDEARNEIRARYAEYLEPAKKRGTYICPLCGNGTGSTGDGLAVDPHGDRLHLKCFNPRCNFYGDLIELYQQQHGCTQQEAFSGLYSYFNISIDEYTAEPQRQPQRAQKAPQEVQYMQEVQKDYTEYYRECKARISDPAAAEYLALRGLSPELAHRFWIGFDPAWRSPAAIERGKNPPSSPRLIIPTSTSSYIARDTRPDVKDYAKMKEGEVQLFNTRDLYNADDRPVFITEGEIDALSIIEAGGLATALGSAANYKMLVDLLRDKRTNNTLILSLDNDDAGRKTSRELAAALQGLNISYISADIAAGYKDPNEALTADREAFTKAIRAAERQTAAKPDSMADYISRAFDEDVERFKTASIRKTGLPNLDKVAGGIYPGLYVMGAISALGKTTLIHQIADQMAGAGEHVLFFSLEQSRFEMASKSLARITAYRNIRSAVSSLDIRKGNITLAVQEAQKVYAKMIAPRMSIIEGNFNCNISFIGDYVARYIKK